MPVKKAAKKAPKKAAKKGAKHHHDKRHAGKDLRRAYEHLGRVQALESIVPATVSTQIATLTALAQKSLHASEQKSAADLLRAAEHLAFGSLASPAKATRLGDALEEAINAEYEHLMDKAARETTAPQAWRNSTTRCWRQRVRPMEARPIAAPWSLRAAPRRWPTSTMESN
jgi:hypothetical protein